eukprot:GFYU01003407.1.p1 GENE.GFYU01003407.1~~GFYU01003407.1.p1  ORF type:complete len:700 (-),score=265.72 GFYU01003407.1:140-2239(-)
MNWSQPKIDGVPPPARAWHSFVKVGNDLLVFGGVDGGSHFNDLYALEGGKSWSKALAAKAGKAPSPRLGHTMTVVEGSVFVLGGMFENRYYSDINVLDYANLSWSRPRIIGMVPTARAHHSCTVIGTKLIVFGGAGERGPTNDVGVLDCKSFLSNTGAMFWTRPVIQGKAPPPRSNHTASFVGSNLYIFGGCTERGHFNDLHILHLDTMSWSRPLMEGTCPSPRADHVALVYGDKIIIQGGSNLTKYFDEVFVFDTANLSWSTPSTGGKKMTARAQHSACIFNDNVYFFGGYYGGLYMKALDIRVGGFGRVNDVNVLELDSSMAKSAAPAGGSAAKSSSSSSSAPAGDSHPEKFSLSEFDFGATLGTGSFGRVKVCKHRPSGKYYALKMLKKYDIVKMKQLDHLRNEVQILNMVKHPFMVNMYGTFQDTNFLYLLLEYVVGGEFFTLLRNKGRFSNDQARFYGSEILLALEHLHSKRILYRDLKPENILLGGDGFLRLTDFGLSRQEVKKDGEAKTFCGTPEYLAPEILNGVGHGKAVDWWTLGTLLFEMIYGLPPFYSQNLNTMYEKILRAPLKFPDHTAIPDSGKDILTKLLCRDPKERLGANGADEIKNHPFWSDIDFNDLVAKKIEPPFKPEVSGDMDYKYVDPAFTNQPVVDSLVDKSKLDPSKTKFDGFTYVAPNKMGGGDDADPLDNIGEEE